MGVSIRVFEVRSRHWGLRVTFHKRGQKRAVDTYGLMSSTLGNILFYFYKFCANNPRWGEFCGLASSSLTRIGRCRNQNAAMAASRGSDQGQSRQAPTTFQAFAYHISPANLTTNAINGLVGADELVTPCNPNSSRPRCPISDCCPPYSGCRATRERRQPCPCLRSGSEPSRCCQCRRSDRCCFCVLVFIQADKIRGLRLCTPGALNLPKAADGSTAVYLARRRDGCTCPSRKVVLSKALAWPARSIE